jgi:hypothetical protein
MHAPAADQQGVNPATDMGAFVEDALAKLDQILLAAAIANDPVRHAIEAQSIAIETIHRVVDNAVTAISRQVQQSGNPLNPDEIAKILKGHSFAGQKFYEGLVKKSIREFNEQRIMKFFVGAMLFISIGYLIGQMNTSKHLSEIQSGSFWTQVVSHNDGKDLWKGCTDTVVREQNGDLTCTLPRIVVKRH